MKHKTLSLFAALCLLPALVFAEGTSYLSFTVTNLSNARVFFKSSDTFDFGKRVSRNETKTITYDFPPKVISVSILNEAHHSYELVTDPSCDVLGLPAYRQPTEINGTEEIKGAALYKAGNVHITISETPESTIKNRHLMCSLSND